MLRILFIALCSIAIITSCGSEASKNDGVTSTLSEGSESPGIIDAERHKNLVELAGSAQGTTFSIKYIDENRADYSEEIAKILQDIDASMSLWKPESEIIRYNSDITELISIHDSNYYFADVFLHAKEVYQYTDGYFDPSINELIEFWGFGLKKEKDIDVNEIPDILNRCSFSDKDVKLIEDSEASEWMTTIKKQRHSQLNFNAIAQGYAVDEISAFLFGKGVKDYFVELGGEIKVNGKNQNNERWSVGVDRPISGERIIDFILFLDDSSVATSGSYRKFIMRNGKRHSHTIDPKTGYPVTHNLLSVTVEMELCTHADAYATAFMVMGKDKTLDFLKQYPELGIKLIMTYEEEGELRTYISEDMNITNISK